MMDQAQEKAERPLRIKMEAHRRILALTGSSNIRHAHIRQLNASMRATELLRIRIDEGGWTPDQEAEAVQLQALADAIQTIRQRSHELEQTLPSDYWDDRHWP